MSHTKYPIQDLELEVINLHFFNPYLFEIVLASHTELPPFNPGQFAQILIKGSNEVFLRRPISIYKYIDNHTLSLLIQDVGRGTHILGQAQKGDIWQVLLPLGNGFGMPTGERPLLIGGGVGVAPLLALGDRLLKEKGIQSTYLLGAKNKDLFPDLSDFKKVGDLYITTEDGTLGECGYVTNHSIVTSSENVYSEIYTCGPTPMMKAVARWAEGRGLPCQVSLENLMGCGMGVCLCCVEPTIKGHKTVCQEGPVFDTNELLWK